MCALGVHTSPVERKTKHGIKGKHLGAHLDCTGFSKKTFFKRDVYSIIYINKKQQCRALKIEPLESNNENYQKVMHTQLEINIDNKGKLSIHNKPTQNCHSSTVHLLNKRCTM